jgi:hypothetical protein
MLQKFSGQTGDESDNAAGEPTKKQAQRWGG